MSYLDRLKNLDSGKRPPTELPKVPKAPYDSYGSICGARSQKSDNPAPIVGAGGTAADFDHEFYEERAAVFEYDGGFPRDVAESMALQETLKWQTLFQCRTLQ